MTTTSGSAKAFAVLFEQLTRWDPPSFQPIEWQWPKSVMRSIREVLRPRKEKVDRTEIEFSDLQPITIHFDGSIDRRDVSKNQEYSMDLYWARPGDVVVAKIDLKNGAVGIVPQDWRNVVVTGHFAVYQPDLGRVFPPFFHCVVQAPFFRDHLWRNKVGAEGRKEVKLDFFEALEIPLPPLRVQQALVRYRDHAQGAVQRKELHARNLRNSIATDFVNDLGLSPRSVDVSPKAFAVNWEDFKRWSISHNQASLGAADLGRGKYPVVTLGSLLELVQYGTSEKANVTKDGLPVLRISNIKDGSLDLSSLKHVPLSSKTNSSLRLCIGDILLIRTSGSRDLVGTSAVFHEPGDYVFASYLIRLRLNGTRALPDYVAFFLNSPLGRQQVEMVSRQIMQNNINSDEIRSLLIPLPPMEIQRTIMQEIQQGLQVIAQTKESAKRRRQEILDELEEMILGRRPIPQR